MARLLTKFRPKRRWVQVSLRTVLALVTLLCIALSLWVVPAERQRRAVAAIEGLGGTVWYQEETKSNTFATAYLRRWLPPNYFGKVELVDFDATWVTDAGLAHLQGLPSLQELNLDHTHVTDAGLAHLQGLRSLQWLSLRNTEVTGAGFAHLHGLTSLQELELNHSDVTDAGLAHLRGLTSLQWLYLRSTQVTDTGLARLQGLTSLQELELYDTQVTDAGVNKLRQALPTCKIWGP